MGGSDWNPAEIVAALKKRGQSLSSLSKANGYHPTAAGKALKRSWPMLEIVIARALGEPPEAIWPSRYGGPPRPIRQRRGVFGYWGSANQSGGHGSIAVNEGAVRQANVFYLITELERAIGRGGVAWTGDDSEAIRERLANLASVMQSNCAEEEAKIDLRLAVPAAERSIARWRANARDLRILAATMIEDGARLMLFRIAAAYENMARNAVARSAEEDEQPTRSEVRPYAQGQTTAFRDNPD